MVVCCVFIEAVLPLTVVVKELTEFATACTAVVLVLASVVILLFNVL